MKIIHFYAQDWKQEQQAAQLAARWSINTVN